MIIMKNIQTTIIITFTTIILFISMSCEEEKGSRIGIDFLHGDTTVLFTDSSFTIKTYTLPGDSLRTDGVPYVLLGAYTDKVFGEVRAEVATELYLSRSVDFGENPVPDSALLYLSYLYSMYVDEFEDSIYVAQYFGDSTISRELIVYELTEKINDSLSYYASHDMTGLYNENEIGRITYTPYQENDDELAIRLSQDFAAKLLTADTTTMGSQAEFSDFLPGIYIKPSDESTTGGMIKFDFNSGDSRLSLFYSNQADDSLFFNYNIHEYASRYCLFKHNYTSLPLKNIETYQNTPDSLMYIQTMSGVRGKIEFVDITNLAEPNEIAVKDAKLYIEIDQQAADQDQHVPPNGIVLYICDENGEKVRLREYYNSKGYFGENIDVENNQYVVTLTDFVQQLIDNDITTNSLYVYPYSRTSTANRTIIRGGSNLQPMRLVVVYSKF